MKPATTPALRPFTTAALCILLIIQPFHGEFLSVWYMAQGLCLFMAICEIIIEEWKHRGDRPWYRNIALESLGIFAITVGAMTVAAYITNGSKQVDRFLGYFLNEYAPILLFGIIAWRGRRRLSASVADCSKLLKTIDMLIWVWFFLVLLSAAAAKFPSTSFEALRKETGVYIIIYLLVVETATHRKSWIALIRTTAILGCILCLLSCIFYFYYGHILPDAGQIEAQEWMRDRDRALVYHNPPYDLDYPWRATWPGHHPNRLASYGIIVAFAMFIGAITVRKRELNVLWALTAAIPVYAIFLSITRGAQLAIVAGIASLILMLFWFFIRHPRVSKKLSMPVMLGVIIAVLAAGGIGYVLMPQYSKKHVQQIFTKQFWQGKTGSIAMRIPAWYAAKQIADQNPWLGVGEGWEHFENEYIDMKANHQGLKDLLQKQRATHGHWDTENKPHAHMNLLENLAEHGYPALGVWILLHSLLALALAIGFLKAPNGSRVKIIIAALAAMHLSILLFGLTNFSLRYRSGMLIWFFTGLTLAILRIANSQPNLEDPDAVE